MRGQVNHQASMFIALNIEDLVPQDHPLRAIKRWCDSIFQNMRPNFQKAYSQVGRPSIPPEQLLKALLLQGLYSIPSEHRLIEAIKFNMLYRWFLDLPVDDPVWTRESFSMNRERFARHDLVRKFFERVVAEAIDQKLVSADHFTVDGTLIRSWASHKSFKPIDSKDSGDGDGSSSSSSSSEKGRDVLVNWRGEKRSNATHRSMTDPEAMLARKSNGQAAHLCHSAHVLMENRSGLCLDIAVTHADGKAERRQAKQMLRRVKRRHGLDPRTLGTDAGYDDGTFLADVEDQGIVPHTPVREGLIQATDRAGQARRRARRRMNTVGYSISQRVRKRVEQIIGWCKTTGQMARTKFIGHTRIEMEALARAAGYNLLRMSNLRRAT